MHRTRRENRALTPPEPPVVVRHRADSMTPNAISLIATCGMKPETRAELLRWMLATLPDDFAADFVSRLVELGSDYLVAAAFEVADVADRRAAVCNLAAVAAAEELAARERLYSRRGVR